MCLQIVNLIESLNVSKLLIYSIKNSVISRNAVIGKKTELFKIDTNLNTEAMPTTAK